MRVRDGPFAAANESTQAQRPMRALTLISQYIGVFISLTALVILCGWIFNIPFLKTPFPGAIPMKADAAICFLFTGTALWLLRSAPILSTAQKTQRYLGYFLASLTAVIGLLTLLEYSFNWNMVLDQLIVKDAPVSPGTVYPGRMSLFAAVNFLVTGLALLLLEVKSRHHHHPSSYLMIIVGLTGLVAIIGYIYGAGEFVGVPPYTPLALDAAIGFLLLFIGLLLARPTAATFALVAGHYPGSRVISFLIPAFIVLVILTGWLRLRGQLMGYYSTELGIAFFSLINIAVATAMIFLAAMRLYTAERRRRRAELEIRELNANLEQLVTQRTGDLRKSEEKYRLIFENAMEGIFQSTPEGKYVSINPAFARIAGFSSPDEMINSITDIQKEMYVHPEDRTRLIELLTSQDSVNGYEFEIKRHDGTKSWVSIDVRGVRDRTGKIIYLEGTLIDITERKRAEEALIKSEEKYRSLFNNAELGMYRSKIDGSGILEVNDKLCKIIGYSREEILSDPATVHWAKAAVFHEMRQLVKERGVMTDYEFDLINKNGEIRTCLGSAKLYPKEGYFEGSLEDITERKRAEQALRESEEKYRLIFENSVEGIYQSTPEGRFLSVNPAFARIAGFDTPDQMINSITDIQKDLYVHPEERTRLLAMFADSDTVNDFEIEIKLRDGTTSWVLANFRSVRDATGKIVLLEGTLSDIAKRKRAEQALRESEEKFRNVFDYSAIGKSITTFDGKVNPNLALADMLGYSLDELAHVNWQDVSFPDDFELTNKQLELLQSGEIASARFIKRYIKKDGSIVWADVNTVLQRDKDGQPLYYITAVMDITERKKAEKALRESEERYRELFDHMASSVAVYEAVDNGEDFIFKNFSHSAEQLEKVRKEDLLGRSVRDVFPGVADFGLFDVFKKVWRTGIPESHPISLYRDSKITGWRENYVYKLPSGEIVAIYDDVTERKKVEEALLSSAIFLNNMVEQSPTPIWISDDKGNLIKVNRSLCELLQVNEEELVGKYNIFNDNIVEEQGYMPLVSSVFEKGEVARFELYYDSSRLKGLPLDKTTTLILDVTIFPITDASGRITNAAIQHIDLTNRKKAEERVLIKTLELERSNTELERFAYVASHDLQEPLRTISSYLQLLERKYKERLDDKGLQYMDFTVTAANRLQGMISGLLEYSRVETRGQPFETVDCESVLLQTVDNLRHAIDESKAEITHDQLPTVMGDRGQLMRLFQNLLANSIRYRSQEPPRIHVSAKKQKGEWVFSVKDNGIGIDPEYKDQIFVIFQRLHGREIPGIGLGLSVAKKIAERHGGRIWLESEPGKGSTFYFTIPAEGGKRK